MPTKRGQPRHGAADQVKALLAAAAAPALIVACLGVLFLKITDQHAQHAVPADGKRIAAQVLFSMRVPVPSDACQTYHRSEPRTGALYHCSASNMQLRELASFSVDPWPAVTRVLFTQADLDARR